MPRASPGESATHRTPQAPSLRVDCPDCDTKTGQRCQVWKTFQGQRLYRIGPRANSHPARTAAARAAGHQLPAGRTPDKDTR